MKKLLLGISCLLMVLFLSTLKLSSVEAAGEYEQKLFELRGAWVATVSNIDIQKQGGTSQVHIENYKKQFLAILDTLEKYNINTVFFQVRPANDAFYPSEYNPWSQFLLGYGKDPGWDPLGWMVAETHKRGMEFHAWLNPYRVSPNEMSPATGQTTEDMKWNYIQSRQQEIGDQDIQNPLFKKVTKGSTEYQELIEQFVHGRSEKKIFLNPAKQSTIDFISTTVEEIITNYEVDGIHFDDYFYPSGGIETEIENRDYAKYGNGMDINAWRRNNVDRMVKAVHDVVEEFNNSGVRARKVRFGISPAAVWASGRTNAGSRYMPGGMDVPGTNYSSYFDLHADTRKWVLEEWIDYILPQCYMEYNDDYRNIVSWWANTVSATNVKLYIGLAPYRYVGDNPWTDDTIIYNQLLYNNRNQNVSGAVFFSYKNLPTSAGGNALRSSNYKVRTLWSRRAMTPVYVGDLGTVTPANGFGAKSDNGYQFFINETPYAKGYILYRYGINEEVTFTNDKIYQIFNQTTGDSRQSIEIVDEQPYKYVLKTVAPDGTVYGNDLVYKSTDFPVNQAPVISNIVVGNGSGKVPFYAKVPITFEVRDNETLTQDLEVTISVYEGTKHHFTSDKLTPKSGNQYEYLWETLPVEIEGLTIVVTATDKINTTTLESEPFAIAISRHEQPTGYKITVKDGVVTISNAEGLEFSFDGVYYFDETEFDAPDSKQFDLYIRVKKSGGLEASLPVIEKVKVSSSSGGTSCPTATLSFALWSSLSLVAACIFLRKRG